MSDTIFSKIIRGEIPSHKVYEDDHVIAILDIAPLAVGHTLVIPKEPAATLDELGDDHAGAVGRVLPRIARAVMKVTGADSYNILQNNGETAGQAVMHVHFHVIPCVPGASTGEGLVKDWNATSPSQDELLETGKQIKRLL